jgi:hypothetical protein
VVDAAVVVKLPAHIDQQGFDLSLSNLLEAGVV